MKKTADYVVNVGLDFCNMEPVEACYLEEEAKLKAQWRAENDGVVAEVVYMPCGNEDVNEVIYQTDGENEIKYSYKKLED